MLLPARRVEVDPAGARETELRIRKAQEIAHGVGLQGSDDDVRDLVDGQAHGAERGVELLAGPNFEYVLILEFGTFLREGSGIGAAIDEHDMLTGADDKTDQLQLVVRRLAIHPENFPARRPFPAAEADCVDAIDVSHQRCLSFRSWRSLSGAQ